MLINTRPVGGVQALDPSEQLLTVSAGCRIFEYMSCHHEQPEHSGPEVLQLDPVTCERTTLRPLRP